MLSESNRVQQVDKRVDSDVSNQRFENHLFLRLVAKQHRFSNVDFRYSIFDTCYLRGCVFDSCDFTGCKFVGANLYGTSFVGCKFDYATFERTIVDSDLLDSGCPGHENLKMRFARTLRMNFQQIGDARSANKAIRIELQATEIHLHKAWASNESYYRKKYTGLRRFQAFAEWIEFRMLEFIWGNGESALKLLRSILLLLVAMALIDVIVFRDGGSLKSYIEALRDSPQVFLGTLAPSNYSGLYVTIITLLRLVAVGFLLAIIVKRLNRR